jgi:hypothetical protein
MLRELGAIELMKMFAIALAPMALIFVVWLLSRRFRRTFLPKAQADDDALPKTQADVDAFLRQYDAYLRQRASRASHSAAPLRSTHPHAWRSWISRDRGLEIIQNTDFQLAGFATSTAILVAFYLGAVPQPPSWIVPAAWVGFTFCGFMTCLKILALPNGALSKMNTRDQWLEFVENADFQLAGFVTSTVLLAVFYLGAIPQPPSWIVPAAWVGFTFCGLMTSLKILALPNGALSRINTHDQWLEIVENSYFQLASFVTSTVLLTVFYLGAIPQPPSWIVPAAWVGFTFCGFMTSLKIFVLWLQTRSVKRR